jgi:mannose-6-phosphate isomerase-like protein (cupin superfamily)
MSDLVERIQHGTTLLAVLVRAQFREPGVHFFTSGDLSQQLAFMRHPGGLEIKPHLHNPVLREVHYTQEVLLIRKGVLRVDFYDEKRNYLDSRMLFTGDTILLVTGGHGFRVIEEVEMIEVKQGPYCGEQDKTRFDGIEDEAVVLRGEPAPSVGTAPENSA